MCIEISPHRLFIVIIYLKLIYISYNKLNIRCLITFADCFVFMFLFFHTISPDVKRILQILLCIFVAKYPANGLNVNLLSTQ